MVIFFSHAGHRSRADRHPPDHPGQQEGGHRRRDNHDQEVFAHLSPHPSGRRRSPHTVVRAKGARMLPTSRKSRNGDRTHPHHSWLAPGEIDDRGRHRVAARSAVRARPTPPHRAGHTPRRSFSPPVSPTCSRCSPPSAQSRPAARSRPDAGFSLPPPSPACRQGSTARTAAGGLRSSDHRASTRRPMPGPHRRVRWRSRAALLGELGWLTGIGISRPRPFAASNA